LIADLKQPRRFLYVLLRPQWRSWLVRGAYALTAYGALISVWFVATLVGARSVADALVWPGVVLAVITAIYTAFLFAQAKGRDFWQNPLLSLHLLAHALLAGSAVWLIADTILATEPARPARWSLMAALILSIVTLFAEILTTPPTADAHRALRWIIGRPMGRWFWLAGLAAGHVVPLLLLATAIPAFGALAAVLALAGLFVIEWLWVLAPQHVPLS
jgi:formate-dependent nitrite reductase membrane component NrfD